MALTFVWPGVVAAQPNLVFVHAPLASVKLSS